MSLEVRREAWVEEVNLAFVTVQKIVEVTCVITVRKEDELD